MAGGKFYKEKDYEEFKASWTRVCNRLKKSGADLKKIVIVTKEDSSAFEINKEMQDLKERNTAKQPYAKMYGENGMRIVCPKCGKDLQEHIQGKYIPLYCMHCGQHINRR